MPQGNQVPLKMHKDVIPRFYEEAVYNKAKSKEKGSPQYNMLELVEIIIPGDKNSIPVFRVRDEHRNRWPEQYKQFSEGKEQKYSGTPLEVWHELRPERVAELNHQNIYTLEQLAAISDANLSNIGMDANALREAAKAHIRVSKDIKDAEKYAAMNAKLSKINSEQGDQLSAMQKKMSVMAAQLEVLTADPAAKRDARELLDEAEKLGKKRADVNAEMKALDKDEKVVEETPTTQVPRPAGPEAQAPAQDAMNDLREKAAGDLAGTPSPASSEASGEPEPALDEVEAPEKDIRAASEAHEVPQQE